MKLEAIYEADVRKALRSRCQRDVTGQQQSPLFLKKNFLSPRLAVKVIAF